MASGGDIVGQASVVKVEQRIFVDDKAAAANLFLDLGCFRKQRFIVVDELMVTVPIALQQRVADEHCARSGRIHPVVGNKPITHDGHAVKHGFFVDHRCGTLTRPHRFRIGVFEQVAGGTLNPSRFDLGYVTSPEP